MRNKSTFTLLGVVVAILLMSVGYAAIQNIELSVSGNVVASPDQGNFQVKFTGTPTQTGTAGTATYKITGDTTATINVSGLTSVGDERTVKFTIVNNSTDITAYLSNTVTHSNLTYFQVTSSLNKTEISPDGGTSVLSITVKLIKTPISGDQKDTLTVKVIASPTDNGGAGGSGGQGTGTVSFTVDGKSYTVTEGTTWYEWSLFDGDKLGVLGFGGGTQGYGHWYISHYEGHLTYLDPNGEYALYLYVDDLYGEITSGAYTSERIPS